MNKLFFFLFFFVIFNVFAAEVTIPPAQLPDNDNVIPCSLHPIWVGDKPLRKEFKDNISQTLRNFPDFEVHLWTSWEKNESEEDWKDYKNLYVHLNDELQLLLITIFPELFEPFDSLMKQELYAGAKDILQLLLLYEFGGISFDVDYQLKPTIRNLTGPSMKGYYCTSISPEFIVSAPKNIFPKLALVFFIQQQNFLKEAQKQYMFNFTEFQSQYRRSSVTNTTGLLILFTNRILGLPTAEANFHKSSITDECLICRKNVFDPQEKNKIWPNNGVFFDYIEHLGTPSSLPKKWIEGEKEREEVMKKILFLQCISYKVFLNFIGEENTYDCSLISNS